ncbi:MAG TPA: head-tail adaptor protein [Noviherbaspirillum sp.]|nr:head-tail adaptor protein [Noviherbaspirillum sp.]
MAAGRLNKRLRIRAWQDNPSGMADIEPTYSAGMEVWAGVEPTRGSVYYGAKQTGDDVTHLITMRLSPTVNERTVTPSHVIDDEVAGTRYRVKRSMDLKGQGRWLQIEAELLGAI